MNCNANANFSIPNKPSYSVNAISGIVSHDSLKLLYGKIQLHKSHIYISLCLHEQPKCASSEHWNLTGFCHIIDKQLLVLHLHENA